MDLKVCIKVFTEIYFAAYNYYNKPIRAEQRQCSFTYMILWFEN